MMKAFDKPVTLRSRFYTIYFAVAAVASGSASIYSFGYVWWFNIKKSAILGITLGWFWGLQVACMSSVLIAVAFVLAAIPLVAVCELVSMHGDVDDRGPVRPASPPGSGPVEGPRGVVSSRDVELARQTYSH